MIDILYRGWNVSDLGSVLCVCDTDLFSLSVIHEYYVAEIQWGTRGECFPEGKLILGLFLVSVLQGAGKLLK